MRYKTDKDINKNTKLDNKLDDSDGAERAMHQTTHVTSYVFRAPKPFKTTAFIILFSLFAGFIINLNLKSLSSNFSVDNIFLNVIVFGLGLLGIPAILSGFVSTPLAELLGGIFYFRRSFLLAFISTIIIFGVLLIAKFFSIWLEINMVLLLIFCYALIFGVRHSVLIATSNYKHLNTIPSSINQTIFGFTFLLLISDAYKISGHELLFYMFWFSIIFLISTVLWLRIVTRPFRRNFDVNGLLLMQNALTQFTKEKHSGLTLEKEFFSKIGTKADIRLGTICIRKKQSIKNSNQSWKNNILKSKNDLKALILIPSVHPGPFGILGGSNLPVKLNKYVKGITSNLMVFHGPTTHDYNPVTTTECTKLSKAARRLVQNTQYHDKASFFHRETFIPYPKSKSSKQNSSENFSLCAQRFGNGTIYIHTSSPYSTDDIDYPVGEAIIQKAQNETKNFALFIDAHNCLEPGTGQVFFGSKKANNMINLVTNLNNKIKDAEEYYFKCGFANDTDFKIKHGIGPMGIQVLLIKSIEKILKNERYESKENRKYSNAYILIDGNNIIPGLREQIIESLKGLVDEAEVFTTDNHIVNTTMGGYNPVGLNLNPKIILSRIKKLIKEAEKDCEPCEIGINSGIVKNIRILGQNTPLRLSATINATISIMRSSYIACQTLAIAACFAIALL
jgi:putative membrane protein